MKFRIADLTVEMAPKFEPLLSQSKPYLDFSDDPPLFSVRIDSEDFKKLRCRFPHSNDALIEYMYTGALFYHSLLDSDGFLLHASAVAMDGKAYLFSAPSGTGKSTHTALWQRVFQERASIINDDKPAIRCLKEGIFVYGTPWSGKTALNQNLRVPLQGVCFLERSKENEIRPLTSSEAIEKILSQTVRPDEKRLAIRMLDLVEQLILNVPLYLMRCNMDPSAAILSYETMSKGEMQ